MAKLPPNWANQYLSLVRFLGRKHKSEDKTEIKKTLRALNKLQNEAWLAGRGDIWIPEPDSVSGFYPITDGIHYPTLRAATSSRAKKKSRKRAWARIVASAKPFQAIGRRRGGSGLTRAQENALLAQAMVAVPGYKGRQPKYLGKKVPGQMTPASGHRNVLNIKELSPREYVTRGFSPMKFVLKNKERDKSFVPTWVRVMRAAAIGGLAIAGGNKLMRRSTRKLIPLGPPPAYPSSPLRKLPLKFAHTGVRKWGGRIVKTAALMAAVPAAGYVVGRREGGSGKKLSEKQLRKRARILGPTHNVGYVTGRTPPHKRRGVISDVFAGPSRLTAKGVNVAEHEKYSLEADPAYEAGLQYGLSDWWDNQKARWKSWRRGIRKATVGPVRAMKRGALMGGVGAMATETNFMPATEIAGMSVRRQGIGKNVGDLSSSHLMSIKDALGQNLVVAQSEWNKAKALITPLDANSQLVADLAKTRVMAIGKAASNLDVELLSRYR